MSKVTQWWSQNWNPASLAPESVLWTVRVLSSIMGQTQDEIFCMDLLRNYEEKIIVIVLTLHMKSSRIRGVKQPAHGHTASK